MECGWCDVGVAVGSDKAGRPLKVRDTGFNEASGRAIARLLPLLCGGQVADSVHTDRLAPASKRGLGGAAADRTARSAAPAPHPASRKRRIIRTKTLRPAWIKGSTFCEGAGFSVLSAQVLYMHAFREALSPVVPTGVSGGEA